MRRRHRGKNQRKGSWGPKCPSVVPLALWSGQFWALRFGTTLQYGGRDCFHSEAHFGGRYISRLERNVYFSLTHKNTRKMQWAARLNGPKEPIRWSKRLSEFSWTSLVYFDAFLSADWQALCVGQPSLKPSPLIGSMVQCSRYARPPAALWLVLATATHLERL